MRSDHAVTCRDELYLASIQLAGAATTVLHAMGLVDSRSLKELSSASAGCLGICTGSDSNQDGPHHHML